MAASSIPLTVSAQPITLKVHHFWPASELIPTKILSPWCETLVRQSSGRMRCRIYPSMQLGGTPADGSVRAAVHDRSAESSSRAAWDYYQRFDNVEFGGAKALAVGVIDPGVIHMRDKQVHTKMEFRGLKMRVPTRQAANLVSTMGGTQIWMPLPQVAEAVSKGVIDGVLMPWGKHAGRQAPGARQISHRTSSDSRSLFSVRPYWR
ncbi:MAG TPA: hypothetical protein VGL25_15790 [Casimicrobiaceae bacterium]|jgi:TRAP-type C4-dicarboxylate transport system substrate-binding protein